jgi:hypothetical protein
VQPYHPMLFKQGCLPGPELIMKFWRGEAQNHEMPQMWQDMDAAAQKQKNRFDEMQWLRGSCQRLLKPTMQGGYFEILKNQIKACFPFVYDSVPASNIQQQILCVEVVFLFCR